MYIYSHIPDHTNRHHMITGELIQLASWGFGQHTTTLYRMPPPFLHRQAMPASSPMLRATAHFQQLHTTHKPHAESYRLKARW